MKEKRQRMYSSRDKVANSIHFLKNFALKLSFHLSLKQQQQTKLDTEF